MGVYLCVFVWSKMCLCVCVCVGVGGCLFVFECICMCMREGESCIVCMASGVDAGSHVCLFHHHFTSSNTVSILANIHSHLPYKSHSHVH